MNSRLVPSRASLLVSLLVSACQNAEVNPTQSGGDSSFIHFALDQQTDLEAAVNTTTKKIRLEVEHGSDLTSVKPSFALAPGTFAFVNGVPQEPGTTAVNMTAPVTYELRQGNQSTWWTVDAVTVGCRILIDASHDGGVWWFPQGPATGYSMSQPHQGKAFADLLRSKGFEVTELGRDKELTDEMFFGYYIVIRAGGFNTYTTKEKGVYARLISRGTNLVLFTDHMANDPADELAESIGLVFKGVARGTVTTLGTHPITEGMTSMDYLVGSALTNAGSNANIHVLGWLGPSDFADLNANGVQDVNEPNAPPVMGIVTTPKSEIFFIGDMNGLQFQPQPFINNLITWMGGCF